MIPLRQTQFSRLLGRKIVSWLRNIRQWTGLRVEQLFKVDADQEEYDNQRLIPDQALQEGEESIHKNDNLS